ncbi:355_t:CDS:1, partial [Racocetra persica]
PNIYKLIDSLDQEELISIRNYIDSISPQRRSVIEKKLDTIIDKIKILPDNQILKIKSLINTMTYSKGKLKDEILSPYLQKKVIKFVESSLFKHYLSASAVQDKLKKLETKNQKLARSLVKSNNELKSFRMKIVRAKEAKQKYISKIR